MRNLLLLFVLQLCTVLTVTAQKPAPDFTVKDIKGKEHNLYSILESGKVVIIDISATWCTPCWRFHRTGLLKSLHEKYGPNGTNQAVVIFYEGDASTTGDDLKGTGSNTLGDWVTGSDFLIINENPVSFDAHTWFKKGFPTINVVSTDKKIVGDLYDHVGNTKEESLKNFDQFLSKYLSAPSSTSEDALYTMVLSPNPVVDYVTIKTEAWTGSSLQVLDIAGKVVHKAALSDHESRIYMGDLQSGTYIVRLLHNGKVCKSERFIKK